MNAISSRFSLIAAVVLLAGPALADPPAFKIAPDKSLLVVHLFKGGIGSGFAHDHVVRATQFSGQIAYDAQHPERSHISLRVQTRSLQIDEPKLRRIYKLDGNVSPADRKKIAATMHSRAQLDTAHYPTAGFVSTQISRATGDRLRVRGTLSIRGVSRNVTVDMRVKQTGSTLTAQGQLRFKQSSFGYQPYSAALGLVKVKDTAVLAIYVTADAVVPRAAPPTPAKPH